MRQVTARSLKRIAQLTVPNNWKVAYAKLKKAWSRMGDDERKKLLDTLIHKPQV